MKTDKLKDFILQHQDQFDDIEPSEALLQRIVKNKDSQKSAAPVWIKMNPLRWMSAAAASLLLISGIYFLLNKTPATLNDHSALVANSEKRTDTHYYRGPMGKQIIPIGIDSQTHKPHTGETHTQKEPKISLKEKNKKENQAIILEQQELYHYSQLIGVKQKQLNVLKEDEPLLYEQFSSDFEALEKSFIQLKSMSGAAINKEQILQAMINNLKMQTDLLNRQLKVIQNIKQKKQEHYESIYKRDI